MLTHQNYTTQDWYHNVKEYEQNKKILPWMETKKPQVVTTKVIKEKDNIFDPILQTYKDKTRDSTTCNSEASHLKNQLAKNKDRSLRYEQTFDIISLSDKLKGFEQHNDYPAMKSDIKKKTLQSNRVNYHILSNITLDKQNYLPPEQRPVIDHNVRFDYLLIKFEYVCLL